MDFEREQLLDRTAARNTDLWVNADVAGYASELATLESALNALGDAKIYQYVVQIREDDVLTNQLADRLTALEIEEVLRKRAQALAKYETQRTVLAYKVAGEEYLLAAKEYDLAVQDLIMVAKEYAAEVEREEIGLEAVRAEMAVRKEEARLKEISSLILLETYNQAQVAVDQARAKVDVAKANTRALMADIEAEQAELRIIQADLEVAMTEAEKATLQADIAMILADIIVRGLTQVKYDVEKAQIDAGFTYIQSKLDDMLAIWSERTLVENLMKEAADNLKTEADRLLSAQKTQEDLRTAAQAADRDVWEFMFDKEEGIRIDESGLKEDEYFTKRDLMETKESGSEQLNYKQRWAKMLVNQAQRWLYKNMHSQEITKYYYNQVIAAGFITPVYGTQTAGDPVCGALEE